MSGGRGRVLVVNADDFGLTAGVCDGILRAHAHGVVSSTSALVVAPAFDSHSGRLRDSSLPSGIHLCAVGEDPPLLGRSEIPTLVDRRGHFPTDWRQVVRRAVLGRLDPEDLRREFSAQVEAYAGAGLQPTHVDTHQNLHLWPTVGSAVLEQAGRLGVRVLRVPRTQRHGLVPDAVRVLGAFAARRARSAGLVVPDLAAGIDQAGHMDQDSLRAAIGALGRGTGHADLTVHPGAEPDTDRTRYPWSYAWGDELRALVDPRLPKAIAEAGFTIGSFADLADAA